MNVLESNRLITQQSQSHSICQSQSIESMLLMNEWSGHDSIGSHSKCPRLTCGSSDLCQSWTHHWIHEHCHAHCPRPEVPLTHSLSDQSSMFDGTDSFSIGTVCMINTLTCIPWSTNTVPMNCAGSVCLGLPFVVVVVVVNYNRFRCVCVLMWGPLWLIWLLCLFSHNRWWWWFLRSSALCKQ